MASVLKNSERNFFFFQIYIFDYHHLWNIARFFLHWVGSIDILIHPSYVNYYNSFFYSHLKSSVSKIPGSRILWADYYLAQWSETALPSRLLHHLNWLDFFSFINLTRIVFFFQIFAKLSHSSLFPQPDICLATHNAPNPVTFNIATYQSPIYSPPLFLLSSLWIGLEFIPFPINDY